MELIEQFKQYLLSQKKLPSRITVKNYKADVRQFIRWFEAYFNRKFEPQAVTSQILELYKNPRNQPAALSSRSLERHLSSLRKFFQFLKIEGIIRVNPFELDAKRYTLDADPWHLKDFKNYLYIYNASHLTIKNYIIDVRQFLKWVKEVTGIEEAFDVKEKNVFNKINAALLEEYKNRLLQTSFSPASVNRKLSSLRKYLGWAVEQDLLKTQIQSQVFRRQAEGVGVATSMVKGQKGSSAAAKTQIGRQNQNEYSRLAPIRLGQKLSKGISFLFDAILVAPLAKILEQGDYLLWKIKGKPIFGKRAVTGKTKISVSNLKKELYAPYKVSTKYFPLSKKIFFHLRHTRPKWYQTYHSHSITHYFHLAILIIFTSAVGFGLYQTYIQEPQTRKSLLAAAPASPPRILSFQGRLTDAQDNPITTEKLIRFQIYNDPTATGSGSLLWQEVNKIIPDTDGIFSILLGNTSLVCSDPLAPASGPCLIPQSLFAENATLYLGITIENDSELKPRQQLATVAYAVNAEVLQGMPPTTDSTLKTNSNAILALNSSGTLAIGGTATTTFQTTNGQFKLTGQPLLLTTNPGTSQNISIEPDGIGKIDLRKPLQNTSNNNNISSASGALEIDDSLLILATSSGQSALIINQNGTGPLISASTSGIAKFTVDNTGRGYFADSVGIGTTNSYNFKVQVEGSIGPNSDLQHYLGSSSKRWARVYANELIGGTSGIQGYWQRNSQALSPTTITDDLLLGATATASALVKLTGTSGNNSWINTGNVGIGDTSPASTLTVGNGDLFQVAGATGNITTAGDLAVNGGDLTTTATTFNLINDTATTLNIGGAATTLSMGASTGTTTINNALSVSGRATFSQAPTQAHTGTWAIGSSTWNQANATIYINPASATADSNLIGAAVAGSVVFSLDAEGDIFGRNLVLTGSTSTGNTTIAGDLSVEGNTTLGDTPTDTLTINPTAWTATPTISGAVTMTSGFDSNAASTVAGLTVDGNGNLTVSNGTLSVTAPSTTGNAAAVAANSLTTGTALDLSSTSTAGGASGVSTLLKLTRSGINANLAHTAYGLYSTVTNTNATSGTNIAGYFSASGATTANYGLIVAAGNVGIGTGSPQAKTMIVDSQTSTSVNGAATLVLANKDTTANNYTGLYISDSDDSAKLGWIAWKLKRGANKDTTLELGTQVSGVGGTRMVIDGGSVGIGTTSPGAKLDIAVSNAPADPSAGGIYLYNSGTTTTSDAIIATRVSGATGGNPFYSLDIFGVLGWSMGVDNADSDKFKIMKSWNLDANPYLTIDTSGNVGIGTTGPGAPLEVRGASGGVVYISTASGPNTALWFREGTTNKGIVGVGDAGNIFTGASADSFSIRAEGDLHLGGTGDNLAMTIKSGSVGIGDSTPTEGTLVVAGTIYATTQATGVNEAVLGGRTLTAGAGLTGTGNLTADRTFNVGAGTCITANADDVAVTADCIGDTQLAYNTGQHLTTTSTPQFARLGLGAAADGTYLLNLNGALVHGTSTGVGIGATDPASKLEIQGAGGSQEDILRLKSVPTAATHGPFISFEGASGNNVTGAIGQEDDGILGESDIVFRASNSGAKTSIATLNELVRFKHDGSVGIGTTGPSSKLDVNGYIYARNPESAGGYVRIGGLDTYRGIYADGLLAIGAGANAIVLNGTGSGTGNVGIGTATPTNAKLEVNGNIYIPAANSLILGDTGRVIKAPHTAALGSMVFTGHTAAYSPLWSFRDQNDTAIMAIGAGTGNNNVGIGTTSPGAKLEVTGDIWLSKDDNRQILLATGTTTGRNLSIIAGGGSDGVGGTLNLRGGNGAVSGGGGSVFIYGGSGFGSSGNVTLGHDGTNVIGDVYVGMDTQYSQRLCHSGADGATGRFILGDCSGGGADLAEYYGAEKNSEPGDVVSIHPNQNLATVKSSIPYDNKLLGVISTQPYDVMGNTVPQEDNPQPVALIGRAPVKVSTENGPIAIGDPLTSSSQPGVAMKATKAGPIVGKALEAFDADGNTCSKSSTSEESKATSEVTGTCQGKIMAFVNVSWYDPDVYLTSTGDLNIVLQPFSNETMQQSASGSGEMATLLNGYIVKDAADRVIDRVGAFAELAVANLRTGLLEAQEITTNSLTVTSDSVTIDGQSLRNYIASLVSETLNSQLSILNPQKIVSPLAEVDIVRTNVISPLASNDVTIRLGASQGNTSEVTGTGSSDGGKLIIENASGSAVASIDSSGNARLAGDLQARQASFSGQLSSNQLTSNEASIAGTLRAKNIIADSIEGLDQRIASSKLATSSGQNNYTLDANKLDADLASFSAQLAYIENLSADFVKFNQGLMVFGPASFADVSVVGQFSVGGNLILADNSINVLGSNLELQPLKQGSLSIMGGLVNIDTEGNLKVGGNAEFARDVTVRGNLAANIISPIPDQDLVIRLGASQGNTSDGDPQGLLRGEGIGEQQFRIENASGSAVLAVNQQGDLTASGSGNFSDILAKTFNIVRSAQADTSMTETIATSSAGTATIIAGETERTIVSPYVAEKSLIYITPTSDTQGATPYVARQTKGLFTIQIPRRVYQDINLNWWIAN